jgi:hypothetical protein
MRTLPVLLLAVSLSACPSPDPGDGAPPPSEGDLLVQDVPSDHAAAAFFDRFVTVFGATVYASADVPEAKLMHAASVFAEYIDNDEDGEADDLALPESYAEVNAALLMFATLEAMEASGVFDDVWLDDVWGQGHSAQETLPDDGFDITLEEVLHLVNTAGHTRVYPDAFDPEDSLLTDAMDIARGGHFEQIPDPYPADAWYHYDDDTCDYGCMSIEYLYWAHTTLLDAQSDPDRCDWISGEWELCTPAQLEAGDVAVHQLLTDPTYSMASTLPDGTYDG